MVYTIVLGVVIVALGAASVVYTFWHEGSPISARERHHDGAS
jgi:hypothetical protein